MSKPGPARGSGRGVNFLRAAIEADTDECILWPFYRMKNGYGQVSLHDGSHLAHRTVCIVAHGEPPQGKPQAAHHCGQRACVNPNHIRWASQTENEADKFSHGTWYSRISAPKLSAEIVHEMRLDHAAGFTVSDLVKKYSTPESTVIKVVRRVTWKHVA